jgi:hypothetical protein
MDVERQLDGPTTALMGCERCFETKRLNYLEAVHHRQS